MIDLFIGSTVRSGGSLLARLFDHHPDVASYPFELHLPMDPALHPSMQRRGEKNHVQDHPAWQEGMTPHDVARAVMLAPDQAQCLVGRHFLNGRLAAKSRDLEIPARFDHARFLAYAHEGFAAARALDDVYGAVHRALFSTWDDGAHAGSMRCVVYHRANGLFCDVERFLRTFRGALFLQPIRSLRACLASEKRKVVSQLVSGQVLRGFQVPDRLLKRFSGRFVENTIVNWLVVFTRALLLKERLGERYVVFRFEELVERPDAIMRALAARAGLAFHESLLTPTNAGLPWAGNSMFGSMRGIDARATQQRIPESRLEQALIERYAGRILEWLDAQQGLFDFASLDRAALFDLEHQQRYFDDREKTALYLATQYERWRYRPPLRELFAARPKPYYL